MAFIPEFTLSGENFEIATEMPTTASTAYTKGEVLALSSGALVAGATDSDGVQQFISLEDYTAPASGNRALKVLTILPSHIFRTAFSATPTGIAPGSKVKLTSTTVDGVTATTTKGVAEVVDMLGATASGDECLVRFS